MRSRMIAAVCRRVSQTVFPPAPRTIKRASRAGIGTVGEVDTALLTPVCVTTKQLFVQSNGAQNPEPL